MSLSIAIAHDQLKVRGGAERVAFEMARMFDAPIYAARVDDDIVPDDITAHCITDSSIGERAMHSHYLLQDMFQMVRWQNVQELYDYDVIIENKTNPWWFVPKDDQTVVRYAHSPPRGLYDQFHRQGRGLVPRLMKLPMRSLFQQTVPYADAWLTNSDLVKYRLHWSLGVPAEDINVVYPPVDVESYCDSHAPDKEYYFTYSRLVGHKRIGEIIAAINQLNKSGDYRLVVGGTGDAEEELREQAGEDIEFVGWMSEEEKRRRLAECKALIFAAENEDFGMVPIEAFASGTPVIGVKEGFTEQQILAQKNGILWPREGGHLREAIRHFDKHGVEWSSGRIEQFAERFSTARFRERIREAVDVAVDESQPTPPWKEETVGMAEGESVGDRAIAQDGGTPE